ncbi:MAG: hypothetical protein A3F09_02900 [Chlamydiae bacterium RIFCSPHIGHO2_12_FULL_49_11]|nr:MAG: hypothetical protein A3F09_02900 [Chlamydiae bacterium RIFCSPHIGHO2_12_FULL_49_11]
MQPVITRAHQFRPIMPKEALEDTIRTAIQRKDAITLNTVFKKRPYLISEFLITLILTNDDAFLSLVFEENSHFVPAALSYLDSDYNTVFHYAALYNLHCAIDFLKPYVKDRADCFFNTYGETPAIVAVQGGNVEALNALFSISRRCTLNLVTLYNTALMVKAPCNGEIPTSPAENDSHHRIRIAILEAIQQSIEQNPTDLKLAPAVEIICCFGNLIPTRSGTAKKILEEILTNLVKNLEAIYSTTSQSFFRMANLLFQTRDYKEHDAIDRMKSFLLEKLQDLCSSLKPSGALDIAYSKLYNMIATHPKHAAQLEKVTTEIMVKKQNALLYHS